MVAKARLTAGDPLRAAGYEAALVVPRGHAGSEGDDEGRIHGMKEIHLPSNFAAFAAS